MASTRSPASRTSAVNCWPTSKPRCRRAATRRDDGPVRPRPCRNGPARACSMSPPGYAPGHLQRRVALTLRRLDLHHPHRRDPHHRHRHRTVLLIPDLGHAYLLADDRPGRHGRVKSFRPQWGPAALGRRSPSMVGTRSGARFACQRSAREARVERSSGCAPRSPPQGGWALGDVVPASGPEIGPTCDVTPSLGGFPVGCSVSGPTAPGSDVLNLDTQL